MADRLKQVTGLYYLISVVAISFILWQWPNEPLGTFLFCVLSLILLCSIMSKTYHHTIYKKSIQYLSHAPRASRDTLNSYVKVHGRLVMTDAIQSPYSNEACAAFTYLVSGIRRVKRKKPEKGLKTIEKKLHTQHSSHPLIIDNGSEKITLDLADLMASGISWVDNTLTTELNTSPINHQDSYESYKIIEKQFHHGDQVILFGMLEEKNEQLILRAAHSLKHPVVLYQGTSNMLYTTLQREFGQGGAIAIILQTIYLFVFVIVWCLSR